MKRIKYALGAINLPIFVIALAPSHPSSAALPWCRGALVASIVAAIWIVCRDWESPPSRLYIATIQP
jgi:hypothetical protein